MTDSTTKIVDVVSEMEYLNEVGSIEIYPVPASDIAWIKCGIRTTAEMGDMTTYDVWTSGKKHIVGE